MLFVDFALKSNFFYENFVSISLYVFTQPLRLEQVTTHGHFFNGVKFVWSKNLPSSRPVTVEKSTSSVFPTIYLKLKW